MDHSHHHTNGEHAEHHDSMQHMSHMDHDRAMTDPSMAKEMEKDMRIWG